MSEGLAPAEMDSSARTNRWRFDLRELLLLPLFLAVGFFVCFKLGLSSKSLLTLGLSVAITSLCYFCLNNIPSFGGRVLMTLLMLGAGAFLFGWQCCWLPLLMGFHALGLIWAARNPTPRKSLITSGLATCLACMVWPLVMDWRVEHYRQQYPLESLTPRLAYETATPSVSKPKLAPVVEEFSRREYNQGQLKWFRNYLLRELYSPRARTIALEHDLQGKNRFGYFESSHAKLHRPRELNQVPENARGNIPEVQRKLAPAQLAAMIEEFHFGKALNFTQFTDYGWNGSFGKDLEFPDFIGHGLYREANNYGYRGNYPPTLLPVVRCDLIGLKHSDRPRVYTADHFPSLNPQLLAKAKQRELQDFEVRGLAKLAASENVYLEWTEDRLLVLGALRCNKLCQNCHRAEEGELLGALSYEIAPSIYHYSPSTSGGPSK